VRELRDAVLSEVANPACDESCVEDGAGPHGVLFSCAVELSAAAATKYDEPYQPYALGTIDLAEGCACWAGSRPTTSKLHGGMPVG
jgi:hypothetical protein